ncbi:MAG TPA: PKD domain-containing protein, partial [Mycobacteriales bacterium]|nr:PKD domain-containing protein [Mycobacteriales bacterium]
ADAVNANATCAANHVGAFVDHGRAGSGEDEFARRPRLLLQPKGVTGGQLITGIHLDAGSGIGSAIRVEGIGVPVLNQNKAVRLDLTTLPGGAAGGTLTITEESPLGPCTIEIPTVMWETKGDIAQAIVSAVHAPGIPGPHRDCPSDHNPRDIANRNGSIVSVLAHAIELRTTDPKIGFDLRAAELTNVHPVANAGGDFAVPPGAPVVLDGRRSSDPDSAPATHDDIAQFEWFDVTSATPQLLGSTEILKVPLTPGRHRIRLRVTDRAGLSDVDESVVTVAPRSKR